MVTIVATLKAAVGQEAFLAEQCTEMAKNVQENEPGCLYYVPFVSLEDPSVIVFVEKYTDAEAFDAHVKTEYFKNFFAAIQPVLGAEPDIQRFED